jgi:hypothetical protein
MFASGNFWVGVACFCRDCSRTGILIGFTPALLAAFHSSNDSLVGFACFCRAFGTRAKQRKPEMFAA